MPFKTMKETAKQLNIEGPQQSQRPPQHHSRPLGLHLQQILEHRLYTNTETISKILTRCTFIFQKWQMYFRIKTNPFFNVTLESLL